MSDCTDYAPQGEVLTGFDARVRDLAGIGWTVEEIPGADDVAVDAEAKKITLPGGLGKRERLEALQWALQYYLDHRGSTPKPAQEPAAGGNDMVDEPKQVEVATIADALKFAEGAMDDDGNGCPPIHVGETGKVYEIMGHLHFGGKCREGYMITATDQSEAWCFECAGRFRAFDPYAFTDQWPANMGSVWLPYAWTDKKAASYIKGCVKRMDAYAARQARELDDDAEDEDDAAE